MKKQTFSQFRNLMKTSYHKLYFTAQFTNVLGFNYYCAITEDEHGFYYVIYQQRGFDLCRHAANGYRDGLNYIQNALL